MSGNKNRKSLEKSALNLLLSQPLNVKQKNFRRLRIAFFGDFCYPRVGGVENHQWALAQELIRRGHKVIAITSTYYDKNTCTTRQHIRWMANGLKIYYTPVRPIFDQNSLPIVWFSSVLMRHILIREQIEIVHYHHASAFMNISNCISFGTLKFTTVFTDHSLFAFSDILSIHINKGIKCSLNEVDQIIAVSNICKENITLRGCLDPNIIHVIPNAVDATKFRPPSFLELKRNSMLPSKKQYLNTINVVMVTRMAFRKGVHLAVKVIPNICHKYPNVRFIIGGDGPKLIILQDMIEYHSLYEQIELLGNVPHIQVRNVLIKGHIFLNCSITESFCIAILEAAMCGLKVVATKVGGVPEVLPPHMIQLCSLEPKDIECKLAAVIDSFMDKSINGSKSKILFKDDVHYQNLLVEKRFQFYSFLRKCYSWQSVAERTERVYYRALESNAVSKSCSVMNRLQNYYNVGPLLGKVLVIITLVDILLFYVVCWIWPEDEIEKAIDFPPFSISKYNQFPLRDSNEKNHIANIKKEVFKEK